jgi:pimeloyl-ACP methyl ester carboxylesterase
MSLFVREAGPSDAPTLLFLHGLGLSGAMWQPQFERFADAYHCLAPDLPGCGNSPACGPFTLKDAGWRVAALIRERVPRGMAHVIGLSLGGAVAFQLLRDEPEVVDHLLVSGTAAQLPPSLDLVYRRNEQRLSEMNQDRLAEVLLRPHHIPQAYRTVLLSDLRKVTPEALWHFIQALTQASLPPDMPVPTLLVVGAEEPFVIQRAVYAMSRATPSARAVYVPGLGHFWNLEAPDLFTRTVRAWIRDEPLPPRLVPF